MKNANIIPLIILISAFTALPANAEMYKWKDKNGEIHYTQTPPPAGTDGKDIEADIKLSTGKLGNGGKTKTPDKAKDELTEAEAAGKQSEEKHHDFCTQQENTLKQMTASSLIKWKDDKGERYLTAAEKAAKMQELKQNMETMCRPEMFADSNTQNTSDTKPTSESRPTNTTNTSNGVKASGSNNGDTANNNNSSNNTSASNTSASNNTAASAAPAAQ